MNWTKNLSKILLPRSWGRGAVRQWQTLQDHADRDTRRNDDAPDYAEAPGGRATILRRHGLRGVGGNDAAPLPLDAGAARERRVGTCGRASSS